MLNFAFTTPNGLSRAAGHMVAAVAGAAAACAVCSAQAATVVNPALPVAGISQQNLAEQWWQWIFSLPEVGNPVLDPDGSDAYANNSGPVFFLAGNFGGATTRSITVPFGRPVFFPVINSITGEFPSDTPECIPPVVFDTVGCLLPYITPSMDNATGLYAVLDGQDLLAAYPSFRQTSTTLFDLTLPDGNLYGEVPGYYPSSSVSDGYWVALQGLAPGDHTLTFGGTSGSGFSVAITANLVVPEPGALPLVLLAGLLAGIANRKRARRVAPE